MILNPHRGLRNNEDFQKKVFDIPGAYIYYLLKIIDTIDTIAFIFRKWI